VSNTTTILGQPVDVVKEPRPIGPNSNPEGLLLGHIDIGTTSFHVELVEVHMVNDQQQAVLPDEEQSFDEMYDAIGSFGPFETIRHNDRDYVMFIYPFCQ
jgi:hypothetical protein